MNYSRITLFAGHYGSGKTNIAVNYALMLKKSHANVVIADLDIVNPYFRTKDSAPLLQQAGIKLISSAYANSNLDVPSVPGEMNALFDDPSCFGVIDVGGDDRGALALGRYREKLQNNDVAAYLVINMYRPLSRDAEATVEIMREIEQAGGIRFTGIVNNSNLGKDTGPEDILRSLPYSEEIAEKTKLPVVMTSVERRHAAALEPYIKNLFPIDLEEYEWQK